MRIRCVAEKPYAPPYDLVNKNYAPWYPGEERDVEESLGIALLRDKHFSQVTPQEAPTPKKGKRI